MTEIRKNIQLTEKDFIIYHLTSYLASFTKNLGMLFMAVLFGYMIYYYKTTNTHYWLMVFSGLPTILYIVTIVYYIPKNAKQEFKHSSYKDFQPLMVLRENTLSVERKNSNVSEIKLNQLLSVWETGKYFYFFITKNNTLTLPKRQLTGEEIRFVKEMISALPRKKRKNPFKVNPMHLISAIIAFAFIAIVIIMIVITFKYGR